MSEQPSKTFCVMPFINLATETNGKCKICCVVMLNKYIKMDNGLDSEIHKNDIQDIWNSKYVRTIRTQMLNGEWPQDCFYCKGQEETGNPSPRMGYTERWKKVKSLSQRIQEAKKKDGQVSLLPLSLEPRPGILCNLLCMTCWSMSSSKVYAERKKALQSGTASQYFSESWKYEIEEADKIDLHWSDSEIYLSNVRKCMPGLERLYFTGGEPSLIKSNTLLLKELIAQGKTDLLVSFTTNLTTWNEELMGLLPSFKKVEISCSIDGFGSGNEYIRFPTKWPVMVENLKKLFAMPRVSVSIMSVIQNSNLQSFIQLLYWLHQEGFSHVYLHATMLHGPEFLRPEVLSQSMKSQAIQKLEMAAADPHLPEKYQGILRNIIQQVRNENPQTESLLKRFQEYIRYQDQQRGMSFTQVFPEFQEFFHTSN